MNNEKILLCRGVVGSHAYGYATPESDKDIMSVWLDPITSYLGMNRLSDAKQNLSEEVDETKYEFLHFMSLCEKFNPNVIPLLFLNEYEYVDPVFQKYILNNRQMFVSRLAYFTLGGYAESQDKKVLGTVTGKKGEKRKELIAKFGYDTKAAAQVMRLLVTGVNLFRRNRVILDCAAEMCYEWRSGMYTYDYYLELKGILRDHLDRVAKENVTLPDQPNRDELNHCAMAVCLNKFQLHWRDNASDMD